MFINIHDNLCEWVILSLKVYSCLALLAILLRCKFGTRPFNEHQS